MQVEDDVCNTFFCEQLSYTGPESTNSKMQVKEFETSILDSVCCEIGKARVQVGGSYGWSVT
jgi:hypothetical protein